MHLHITLYYLESCSHRSLVSIGGSSVSVDAAECWGVPPLGLRNLLQVQRRSVGCGTKCIKYDCHSINILVN